MLSYVAIEAFHQIPATIHNKDFVIHIVFFIIIHFMCLATMFCLLSFSDQTPF